MYLTRLKLDINNSRTMRALASPNLFHGAIESAFPGERKRNLWRIDLLHRETYLMILSEDEPDLSKAAEQFSPPEGKWESLPYEKLLDRITKGSRWHFRLTANPTVKKGGKVMAHITAKHQKNWLMKRAERCGFSLDEDEFSVVGSRWYRFRKKKEEKQYVSLLAVTFEGMLTVQNAELFRQTLCSGIGREKAFGMGLLTVARAG